jgi:hypothetical protein
VSSCKGTLITCVEIPRQLACFAHLFPGFPDLQVQPTISLNVLLVFQRGACCAEHVKETAKVAGLCDCQVLHALWQDAIMPYPGGTVDGTAAHCTSAGESWESVLRLQVQACLFPHCRVAVPASEQHEKKVKKLCTCLHFSPDEAQAAQSGGPSLTHPQQPLTQACPHTPV